MFTPRVYLATFCAIALSLPAIAQSAEVTLRFGHFWPATSVVAKNGLKAWAEAVEHDSGGRIDIQMYPSQTLVQADTAYVGVKRGIADITATVQAYTPHRFPLTQVVELPGMVLSAESGSCIVQTLFDEGLIDQEYDDTHVLFLFTHGPGYLHTIDKLVKVPEDLAGMRIRRPTTVVSKMLRSVGVQPVGMSAPGVYQALQRGVIDGTGFPWEGLRSFSLEPLLSKHTEIPLYVTAFVVTMNEDAYRSLPEDLQAVIDANSGLSWARKIGRVFGHEDKLGRQHAVESGDEIYTVPGGIHNPDWEPLISKTIDGYLSKLEDSGLPARKVYERALELKQGSCAP